ncbi:hypothetical protein BH11VER1_BH11VER1_37740 [soil metagenome]
MNTTLTTLALSLLASFAFGHGSVELGPNGGRILEFSKNETMHGEITEKDGKFHIAVLDKDMKPVQIAQQSLTATTGDRNKPEKLEVTKTEKGFTVPFVKEGQWLILQFKMTSDSKPITARLEYDNAKCGECKKPEWLCACAVKKENK